MNNSFVLPEETDVLDLTRYLERAQKLNAKGAVRFRAYGDVLTVYVAPISDDEYAESPLILGLRTMSLAEPAEFDVTVSIASALAKLDQGSDEEVSLVKRLGKITKTDKPNEVQLPEELVSVSWRSETPTRVGWELGGEISQEELTEIARKGVAEITETLPASVGGPIAARVRAEIWGRAYDYKYPVPMGAAFVAAGLGFLTEGEIVSWYISGDWVRVSAKHGHVISKFALDYVSMNS